MQCCIQPLNRWPYKVPDEHKPPPRVNKKTEPRNFCSFCNTCSRFSAKEMLSAPWPVKGPNKSRMWWISILTLKFYPLVFKNPHGFKFDMSKGRTGICCSNRCSHRDRGSSRCGGRRGGNRSLDCHRLCYFWWIGLTIPFITRVLVWWTGSIRIIPGVLIIVPLVLFWKNRPWVEETFVKTKNQSTIFWEIEICSLAPRLRGNMNTPSSFVTTG